MEKIGGPLRDLLERLRLTGPMEGWKAVELWPEVVGERVAARARAVGFRDGVLYVEVENPAWMTELTYLRRRVQDEINRRMESEVVKTIQFRPSGETRRKAPGAP